MVNDIKIVAAGVIVHQDAVQIIKCSSVCLEVTCTLKEWKWEWKCLWSSQKRVMVRRVMRAAKLVALVLVLPDFVLGGAAVGEPEIVPDPIKDLQCNVIVII